MTITALCEAVEADDRRRRAVAWWVGAAMLAVLLSAVLLNTHRAALSHDPAGCADRLGIQWDVVNGATERLSEFSQCVDGGR